LQVSPFTLEAIHIQLTFSRPSRTQLRRQTAGSWYVSFARRQK
jgi:hypothetical protein